MANNASFVIARMNVLAKNVGAGSPGIQNAMLRIAMMIIAKAKINVRRHRMVDTGRLINSLRWEFYRQGDTQGVYIGSFGVKYADFFRKCQEFESRKLEMAEELLKKDYLSGIPEVCFVAAKHALQAALAMKGEGYSSKVTILLELDRLPLRPDWIDRRLTLWP